ncbi:hypothetical protein B0H19DRAFT_1124774 [Mycena capillaripes]|nr:hypothetical protein B0H19DRAFT_1124774 [Mycena capillaripes]
MNPKHTFPNELWLELFTHSSPEALRNVSSTNHALYDIARPLGFTEFKLYPYPYEYQPPQAQLDNALERLQFWSSPKVAPHVRLCTARYNLSRWQGSTQADGGTPHVLVNAFFECLPKFTGLKRLYTDRIQITQLGLTKLCTLPALTYVDLSGSKLAAGEQTDLDSLTLRVATFITRYDQINTLWIPLLSRDSLRELNLSDISPLAKPGVQPFPNVHTLTVNDPPFRSWDTPTIFAKFPAVRIFVSDYRCVLRNMTPAQTSSIFPVLEKYTGACENLHIFVQRSTLTHITFDTGFPFQRLLTELQGVTALPSITLLTARFTTSSQNAFGKAEIERLFTLFPGLNELQLTLYPDADADSGFTPQPTVFLPMLSASPFLPSTLQSLSLDWDFPFEYGSTESAQGNDPAAPAPGDIPDFNTNSGLRNELIARCPRLSYIFLDGYHFLYVWWKTSWVWEATAHGFDDAEVLRAKKTERKFGPPVLLS